MNAQELRIGNYYKWYADGKYYTYQIEAKDFSNDNYKNFKSNPLTEEWLLNFGFVDQGQCIRLQLMNYYYALSGKELTLKE